MFKYLTTFAIIVASIYGLFLFWQTERRVLLAPSPEKSYDLSIADADNMADATVDGRLAAVQDIENQSPLTDPPQVIKAVYVTSHTAGTQSRINALIDLIKQTELNAVVIDIKDYSGYVAYDIKDEDVERYGAKEIRIPRINSLIRRLHDEGIYVIARITIFQDPVLAAARPDWAIKNAVTGDLWRDNKGIAWIDPAAKEAWEYNIRIAKDAAGRGFDELNFDYIRFPSDGDLSVMSFPFYDGKTLKRSIIADFFKHLRAELEGTKISGDLFGLSTVNTDDLGMGQVIEDAYVSFDYVAPMVYPSHYARGFLGFQNPAAHPYEVVKYSMDLALRRLQKLESGILNLESGTTTTSSAFGKIQNSKSKIQSKLRPWLQDFDLGANYDAAKVRAQIRAVEDAGLRDGWMLWNPGNVYTREALQPNER